MRPSRDESVNARYHLRTLGELRLLSPDGDLLPGRRKELLLLAYLAFESPRAVPRARLATLLWGDGTDSRARASLRQALLKLRRALPDAIEAEGDEVGLRDGAVATDVEELEADLAAGRFEEAVGRWGGDFLAAAEEVGAEPLRTWMDAERVRLRRAYVGALEQLVSAAGRRGAWSEAVGWSRRWADAEPYDEAAHLRLIQALRLTGEPEAADRVETDFVTRCRRELDVEPSEEFGAAVARDPRSGPASHPGGAVRSSSALFTPDFVGRADALGELTTAWEAVLAGGPGAVVLVTGEEGVGKTRLCEEYLRWVDTASGDACVLRSRAYSAETGNAWSAARHLLAGLGGVPGLGGAPEDPLAALVGLAPGIRDRFPRLPARPASDLPLDEALRIVLECVAEEAPVLLFLDDFPAADRESRELLAGLARRPPKGVLLLLSAPTTGGRGEAALAPLLEIPGIRRVELQPLDAARVEALVGSMLVLDPSERREIARRIHEAAAGNPLYTVALIAALADAEHLCPDPSGVWRLSPEAGDRALPLPASVRETVRTRLELLSDAARRIVHAAAVLGRPIDPLLLDTVAGLPADDLASGFDELIARRILRESDDPPGGFEFTHELIGRVTYDLLNPATRRALHMGALRAIAAHEMPEPERSAAIRHHRAGSGQTMIGRRGPAAAAIAVAIVVAVVIGLGSYWQQRAGGSSPASGAAAPTLAVMYLDDLSGDSTDAYLAESLTEEIAGRLAQLERLRVKSPRAVRLPASGDSMMGPIAIGAALGVEYLVEGSVRRAGDRLRIAVRLTSASDGFQVWNGSFDAAGAGIFAVQDTIARQIASQVAGRLVPEERRILARRTTEDPRAYDHYLRGNYHLARRTPQSVLQAIEEYRRASRIDDEFSEALAREAYGYALFLDWGWAFPGATSEELLARGLLLTERVLQRSSGAADAWMARAYLYVLRDPLRHAGAVEAFRRSIELDPRNAEVHHQLGQSLTVLGHWPEAVAAYREALELEPHRAMTYVPLAAISSRLGRVEEARRLGDSAIAVDPSVPYAYAARGLRRLHAGDAEGALRDGERALQLDATFQIPGRAVVAAALHLKGDTAAAARELARARSILFDPGRPSPTEMLFVGAAATVLGRHDDAIDLISSTRPRSAWIWFYLQDPLFDPLRDRGRFREIIDEVAPTG